MAAANFSGVTKKTIIPLLISSLIGGDTWIGVARKNEHHKSSQNSENEMKNLRGIALVITGFVIQAIAIVLQFI